MQAGIKGSYERIVAHHWPGRKENQRIKQDQDMIRSNTNDKQQNRERPWVFEKITGKAVDILIQTFSRPERVFQSAATTRRASKRSRSVMDELNGMSTAYSRHFSLFSEKHWTFRRRSRSVMDRSTKFKDTLRDRIQADTKLSAGPNGFSVGNDDEEGEGNIAIGYQSVFQNAYRFGWRISSAFLKALDILS